MFPLRLLDEQPPGELDHFTTGALKDNNLLNKMESVAIAIVNRRCNKFLLGLNSILKQQQQQQQQLYWSQQRWRTTQHHERGR